MIGFTFWMSSSGTRPNSSDTSRPTATPCSAAESVGLTDVIPSGVSMDEGIEASTTVARARPRRLPPAASPSTCRR
jgi:hypothetical protein